ncbi:DUF397 domain-containing protein [Crossiella cryophila]|uniref:DUF397 domain-containing protein n=1 Tax=Crossiella cryophila TaxID=43355 RepID=A0A7W7CIX6_9PSEU|nr:DUF397 domain-containing protein [Crossiella cryophila]MBB4681812.1 hypothetical protein [Crossiella cryophila]
MTRKTWRTSSYSQPSNACVEVATSPTAVHIRDTKNRGGGELAFATSAFKSFLVKFANSEHR